MLGSEDFNFSTDGPAIDEDDSDEENKELMDTNTYTEHQISYSKFLKKIGRCEKESSKLK